jgi:hypothetical protein
MGSKIGHLGRWESVVACHLFFFFVVFFLCVVSHILFFFLRILRLYWVSGAGEGQPFPAFSRASGTKIYLFHSICVGCLAQDVLEFL